MIVAVELRPEYSEALDIAIDSWNDQLGCTAIVRDDSQRFAWTQVHELDSGGSWAGMTFGSYVFIAPDTVGDHALRVFQHELGHRFGLRKHSPDKTHLMYYGALDNTRGPESTGLRCEDLD